MLKRNLLACVAWVVAARLAVLPARAYEADQFTLPPEPLTDLGPVLAVWVHRSLADVMDELNARIAHLEVQAAQAESESQRKRRQDQIQACLADQRVAKAIYQRLGLGWPEAQVELWIREAPIQADHPWSFAVSYDDSIFGTAALARPLLIIGLSPTIRVFGVHMGIDKVGHFFQQGYEYYEQYLQQRARGATQDQATAAAVRLGVEQEQTIFGDWPTGVYSNADLAANYAGFQFFLNLTQTVEIGGHRRPPILIRRDGRWAFNPLAGDDYLQPFITDHFDEAMNPPLYSQVMRRTIHQHIRQRAQAWMARRGLTPQQSMAHTRELATWYGQDYGHSGSDGLITPAEAFLEAGPPLPLSRSARMSAKKQP
jgi:hypothetical protein